jgi:ElaB/YqjD/DUF883 family membrane-anchored ribosome-binding protein
MSSPQQIQEQIETTRDNLSADVNRLADKVSPSAVVGRRVNRIKGSASSLREKVMGAMPDSGTAQSAAGSVQSAAGSVTDAASNAPQVVRQQTQGSPLAAGLIAFGVGVLVSSLIPPSQAEQQLAARAEDTAKEKAQELREPVQQRVQEVAGQLKESAQESAQQVKQTASDAASETAEQARSKAQDVRQG